MVKPEAVNREYFHCDAANGTEIEVLGSIECLVKAEANDIANLHKFFVVQNMPKHQVILGIDFIRNNKIDLKAGQITEFTMTFGEVGPPPAVKAKGQAVNITPEHKQLLEQQLKIMVPEPHRKLFLNLCLTYHDVFSKDNFDLGNASVISHAIQPKDPQKVIYTKQFPLAWDDEKQIIEYTKQLLKKGAIEISRSPHNSPIFCVKKKSINGQAVPKRIVVDFRKLNDNSIDDTIEMYSVKECLHELGRKKYSIWSTLDFTSGFWQQNLEQKSREWTAFTVPALGQKYQFRVTPMGVKGASASFSRLTNNILGDLGILYVDDGLIPSTNITEHLIKLESVFLRLRQYGLKLNSKKCVFATNDCEYLGYRLPLLVLPGSGS